MYFHGHSLVVTHAESFPPFACSQDHVVCSKCSSSNSQTLCCRSSLLPQVSIGGESSYVKIQQKEKRWLRISGISLTSSGRDLKVSVRITKRQTETPSVGAAWARSIYECNIFSSFNIDRIYLIHSFGASRNKKKEAAYETKAHWSHLNRVEHNRVKFQLEKLREWNAADKA